MAAAGDTFAITLNAGEGRETLNYTAVGADDAATIANGLADSLAGSTSTQYTVTADNGSLNISRADGVQFSVSEGVAVTNTTPGTGVMILQELQFYAGVDDFSLDFSLRGQQLEMLTDRVGSNVPGSMLARRYRSTVVAQADLCWTWILSSRIFLERQFLLLTGRYQHPPLTPRSMRYM